MRFNGLVVLLPPSFKYFEHDGERVMLDQVGGFANVVSIKEAGSETFPLCTKQKGLH